ncbi:hypothetical protein CMV_022644 [Castanea mollissima]|uniref:Uncharacterized protein n=1 Tax=Castanea mollissima TaxID=60419 RepID=A0A8J4VJH9_9ROSI|nr:hypothetical protein CMV_022644 [Castanea mollissima]
MSDNAKWLILAVASSVFIGTRFILKKKGLKQAGSTGTRAAQDLQVSMSTQGASTSSPSSSSTPRWTYEVGSPILSSLSSPCSNGGGSVGLGFAHGGGDRGLLFLIYGVDGWSLRSEGSVLQNFSGGGWLVGSVVWV